MKSQVGRHRTQSKEAQSDSLAIKNELAQKETELTLLKARCNICEKDASEVIIFFTVYLISYLIGIQYATL